MARKERSDKESRKANSIVYPRKCNTCDYVSNNPSMFHYHKKTHGSIEGKICDHGCRQPAKFIKTNGKYSCLENTHLCPVYLEIHAERIKEQWASPNSDDRRENAKEIFRKAVHNEETVAKATTTKWSKWGMENATEAQWKEFRKYGRSCRKLSQQWAKDNGYEIGQQTFHVDHIYSIRDGFVNKISPLILSHPVNLRILDAKENSSKGGKSEMTLEELLERINLTV